ncbi:hypothetical protein IscW_ISCW003796 [Ixodes scapularis]|uniref:Reverse transcriptase domain-containing protein n=1 Tax=Ixodes scapularis TaxID=6945 RepID=B7PEB7_IXOSC|nr:hypothetical protein IscW_ISCW003796 [Ixodes scapularis]|eukprot:XP_002400805.1 hypothetical protein IscW_ISCW003796 [Ixodes scapularis]
MCCGICQACPLSGLLFNLVVDLVIRKVQGTTADHCILAYADDLTLLARDPKSLKENINQIEEEAGKLGLSLNAAKCRRMLHLSGHTHVELQDSNFVVNEAQIPVIRDFETFAYLRRPQLCNQPINDPDVLHCLSEFSGGDSPSHVPNVILPDGSLSEDSRP